MRGIMRRMTDEGLRRLYDRFAVGDDCWPWSGVVNSQGYGRIGSRQAHRAVYGELVGPIPEGHHLHHTCGNTRCVRPSHLEPLAASEHLRMHGEALRAQSQRTMERLTGRLTR